MPNAVVPIVGVITSPENELDAEVATRLMGYRWVRWIRRALGDGPLYSPGRFLARPDHMSGHLMEPADPDTPLHAQPLSNVPRWSTDVGVAFSVAEAAGLFADARAVLLRGDDGEWTIEFRGSRLSSPDLASLLCQASLQWHDVVAESTAEGRR